LVDLVERTGLAGLAASVLVAPVALRRFISRDLRRAAFFACSTPLATPRSSAETAVRASSSVSAAPSAAARRNFVTFVLTDDLSERLRAALTALRRASFLEEAMLAMKIGRASCREGGGSAVG